MANEEDIGINSYEDIGLNSQLQAEDSLAVRPRTFETAYDFGVNTQRDSITSIHLQDASINNAKLGTAVIGTAQIGTLSFNEISGGTAILGGTNSGNGVLRVNNQGGTAMFTANGTMIQMLHAGANIAFLLDYSQELVAMREILLGGTFVGSQAGGLVIRNNVNTLSHSFLEDQTDIRTSLIMGTHNFIQLGGTATPGTPTDAAARLYVDQSGGKDRLMVRFNTGSVQQIAIEP